MNLSLDMVHVWDLTRANRLEKGPRYRPTYNSGAGLVCGYCRLVLKSTWGIARSQSVGVPAVPPLPKSYQGSSF